MSHIEDLRGRKKVLIEEKGERLAARLGTKWFNEGEKSTRYFLRLLKRSAPDDFERLINERGELLTEENDIEKEIVQYYKNLYENYESVTTNRADDDPTFFDNVSAIPDGMDKSDEPIGKEELWSILTTCKDSAPGPDGIPFSFLKSLWPLIGDIIVNAWKYSLEVKELAPSHRVSYLRLIPKVGKDLSKLTNWRPITLSNCDHKLITKCYSVRLSKVLNDHIDQLQTAYLKGRLINDNIRSLVMAINTAQEDPNVDGLIVALDAKKAFDSVEHSYIEQCLGKMGLSRFISIFRILYKELSSNVLVNGKIVKGFNILRGFKQGDALSCILFLISMEPIIKNIQSNDLIEEIEIRSLNSSIPKVFCYADDLNPVIKNNLRSLQELFKEYERLTRKSGLQLNAEKTEIIRLKKTNCEQLSLKVKYLNDEFVIKTSEKTKINGIVFQMDSTRMIDTNVNSCIDRMTAHFKSWSQRKLSTLGKIMITKCFGLSQVIYLLQSMSLSDEHIKRINSCLYKFIWNKHFSAAKAPERLTRSITNTPLHLGGLGMLDVSELDKSLKLRAYGRTLVSRHPVHVLLRLTLRNENFFFPSCGTSLDKVIVQGTKLLREDRLKALERWEDYRSNIFFVTALKNTKIKDILNQNGRESLIYLAIRRLGSTKLGQLSLVELENIRRFVPIKTFLDAARALIRINNVNANQNALYPIKGALIELSNLSSKQIREARSNNEPICIFKCGLILNPAESINFMAKIKKLTSVRHRNILLRYLHGDIYTNERLVRFGLTEDSSCINCNQVDTLEHRLTTCPTSVSLIRTIETKTRQLRLASNDTIETIDPINRALGAYNDVDVAILTLHAEVLCQITRNIQITERSDNIINRIISMTLARDNNAKIKNSMRLLFESMNMQQ